MENLTVYINVVLRTIQCLY